MRLAAIALVGIVCATSAEAGSVVPANGNYFTSYTDIEFPADSNGETPKLSRVYNSRSQFRGMFGYGWGNDFDTYLIPSADGSVVVQEAGGGAKTRWFVSLSTQGRQLRPTGCSIAKHIETGC